jgi:hypothetical protein
MMHKEIRACFSFEMPGEDHEEYGAIANRLKSNCEWIELHTEPKQGVLLTRAECWWLPEYVECINEEKTTHGEAVDLRKFDYEDEFDLRSAFSAALNRAFDGLIKLNLVEAFTPYDERITF